jgi:hypothetical protein
VDASGGAWVARDPVGRLALLHGIIEPSAIDDILKRQQASNDYFGQIAIQMGLLTPEQLRTLLAGQAIRGCAEVLEDLILAGRLPLPDGIAALAEFLSSERFQTNLLVETHRGG